jgi:hypothetical protein
MPIPDAVARHEKAPTLRPKDQEFIGHLIQQRKPSPDIDLLLYRRIAPTRRRPYLPRTHHRERGMTVVPLLGLTETELVEFVKIEA